MRNALILLLLFMGCPAMAHDFYSPMCCSDKDCAPAAVGDVVEGPNGYEIHSLKITVPYGDRRVKYETPDNQFHICIGQWNKKLLCLYVPGRSY